MYDGEVRIAILGLIALAACGGGGAHCEDPTQTSCSGTCVDTQSDHDSCGTCGHACMPAEVCANGACAPCPADQDICNGTCVDTSSDAMNCNGCGMACPMGDVCVAGACQPPCDPSMLMAKIDDPWGTSWDGLERPAAALDAAAVTCKAFGARLPTASELYRVAANQSGAVGMSFNTTFLWSLSADDKLNQATIRLSDGAWSSLPAASAQAYRCVCPAAAPRTFSGNRCNGDPSGECFELNGYNFDSKDRPALRKSAAVAECVFERAHLADAPQLASAIRAGLPGSGGFVQTADQSAYYATTMLKWTAAAGWEPNGNASYVDNRNAAPFRCAAPKQIVLPNPNMIANEFVPPLSKYKGETMDTAAAGWIAAHDACFKRGGHLPRSSEYAELIMQGMPNGTNANLWSADQDGYYTDNMTVANFLAEVNNWSGLDTRYNFAYTNAADQTATWAFKTGAFAFRCIYYPIDPAYAAPTSPANCFAGCFEVDLPGMTAAKMWFDSQDRTEASLGAAYDDCQKHGGVLASERDLSEAIRAGLPNGSAAMATPWLWTSDFAIGGGTTVNTTVVRWTNSDTAFSDQYATYMTWASLAPTAYRYRCLWTNELR
jgi:hypothetical protein